MAVVRSRQADGAARPGPALRAASRLDVMMEGVWLLVVGAAPLIFNPAGAYPSGPYKASFVWLAAALLGSLWLVRRALSPALNRRDDAAKGTLGHRLKAPILFAAGALVLSYAVATIFSIAPLTSFWGSLNRMMGLVTMLFLVGFFLLLGTHLRQGSQVQRLLWTLVASATLVALLGILEWLRWIPPISMTTDGRIGSTIGHPVLLGGYLVLTLPLTAAQLLMCWNQWRKREEKRHRLFLSILLLALLLQGLALVLTTSRGSWVGFAAAAVVLAFLLSRYLKHRRVPAIALLAGAPAGLLLVGLLIPGSPLQGLKQLPYLSRAASTFDLDAGSVRSRLIIWDANLQLLSKLPKVGAENGEKEAFRLLVGYGPENFEFAFRMVTPRELFYLEGPRTAADRAHNLYLDSLVATGILGLGSFLLLVGLAYKRGFAALHQTENPQHRLLIVGLLAALSGHLVEKLFGIAEVADQVLFWTVLALLVAAPHLVDKEKPGKHSKAPADLSVPPRVGGTRVLNVLGAVILLTVGVGAAGGTVMADGQAATGLALARQGNSPDALRALEQAVTLVPYRADYHWQLSRLNMALAQVREDPDSRRGFLERALFHVRQAQKLESVNYHYAFREAQMHAFGALALAAPSDSEATRLYKQAAQLNSTNPDILVDWALYELRSLRVQSASALVDRALALDPSYGLSKYILEFVHRHSEPNAAAQLVRERGIEHTPFFLDAYLFTAATYYQMGRPELALDSAVRYVRAAPYDPGGHQLLAAIYRTLGMQQEGKQHENLASSLIQGR